MWVDLHCTIHWKIFLYDLKLNIAKTGLIILSYRSSSLLPFSITIQTIAILPVTRAHTMRLIFISPFYSHIQVVTQFWLSLLHRFVLKIQPDLSSLVDEVLINALIISSLKHCSLALFRTFPTLSSQWGWHEMKLPEQLSGPLLWPRYSLLSSFKLLVSHGVLR